MDLDNIKLIPIKDAVFVPRYLLEQVKGLPFSIDDFYENYTIFYGKSLFSLLYVIVDRERELPIIGVLWLTVNPLSKTLTGELVSIHKEYQRTGVFKKIILPTVFDIKRKLQLKKIYWLTTRVKAYHKIHPEFVPSEWQLMETEVDHYGR